MCVLVPGRTDVVTTSGGLSGRPEYTTVKSGFGPGLPALGSRVSNDVKATLWGDPKSSPCRVSARCSVTTRAGTSETTVVGVTKRVGGSKTLVKEEPTPIREGIAVTTRNHCRWGLGTRGTVEICNRRWAFRMKTSLALFLTPTHLSSLSHQPLLAG